MKAKKMGMKKSSAQGTAVGSGSRPKGGKMPIASSAPKDMHGLGGRNEVKNKPMK